MTASNKHKRDCNCKLLTWNLSTNTAAEFGDLGALAHRLSKQKEKGNSDRDRDRTGAAENNGHSISSAFHLAPSQPLHLAAQHGHITITSFLLQEGYDVDTGLPSSSSRSSSLSDSSSSVKAKDELGAVFVSLSLATPLHRACFSGAIGCVQILLENGANLLAKDNSFGDGMTPLHKAVKGGRYNAVALILSHVENSSTGTGTIKTGGKKHLMRKLVNAVDSNNRTPLELALELEAGGEEEVSSVRRWDVVAGGSADFSKCVQLISDARSTITQKDTAKNMDLYQGAICGEAGVGMGMGIGIGISSLAPLCDCANDNGNCDTAKWESEFQNALLESITRKIRRSRATTVEKSTTAATMKGTKCVKVIEACPSSISAQTGSICDDQLEETKKEAKEVVNDGHVNEEGTRLSNNISINAVPLGQPCNICRVNTIALFRLRNGSLVCRKCKRKHR